MFFTRNYKNMETEKIDISPAIYIAILVIVFLLAI